MSLEVFLAVLAAAVMHAGWNAIIKGGGDPFVTVTHVSLFSGGIALVLLPLVDVPKDGVWTWIAVSALAHTVYRFMIIGAYRAGDMAQVYPIMRGAAPLLVALGSGSLLGEQPSLAAWAGVLCITTGVALVGLARPGEALHHGKALAYALANAAIIAVYTVVDGLGVRAEVAAGGSAWRYVMLLFVLDGIAYPLLVWLRRGPAGRAEALAYARRRWPVAAVGGSASLGSYAIALWAMTRAPVASVAALRETSVLFAALLGTLLLKEPFGLQRAAGTAVIVAGVMALRMG